MKELEHVKQAGSRESQVTVLAIDDESDFLEFVGEAISSESVDFISTTNPEEALAIVHKRHPPVILLDLNMPTAPGMDVLERILGIDPNIDVVMLTADYSTESAVRAIQQGACDYLVKPIGSSVCGNASACYWKKRGAASIATDWRRTSTSPSSLRAW